MSDHDSSRWLPRSALAVLCLLALRCADEKVVGEHDPTPIGGSTSGGIGGAAPDDFDFCHSRYPLPALPPSEPTFPESPAAWVDGARGKWATLQGDTLEVAIQDTNVRVEFVCYDDPDIPIPPGARPNVTFELTGEVALRTADGAWNEIFDVKFHLAELTGDAFSSMVLNGSAELELAALQGSFMLPPNLERPAQTSVQVLLVYQRGGWTLSRYVREEGGCRCTASKPAWSDENDLAFVRR